VTAYLGSTNSSEETLKRAKVLAEGIGSLHFEINIEEAYEGVVKIFSAAT